ncbi:hypothetical protein Tco_1472800, partial [Tanacetum coccineum]
SSSNSNNQADLKFQKDYKAEYKKIKAKLPLLKVSPSSSQNPKTFVRIKRLYDDLEVTAAKLMLLVYKLLLLVFRVNVAGTKLQLLKDYNCKKIKIA